MKDRILRALPFVLALGFAGRAFGIAGVLVVGVIWLALLRWRTPQIVTMWAITGVAFVAVVLLYRPPASVSAPQAASATPHAGGATSPPWTQFATQAPSAPDPPAASDQTMIRDATAFVLSHPDINDGSNLQIMRYYLGVSRASLRGADNQAILADAYMHATADPRWSRAR